MPPRTVKRGAAAAGPKRTARTARGAAKGQGQQLEAAEERPKAEESPTITENPFFEDKQLLEKPISEENRGLEDKIGGESDANGSALLKKGEDVKDSVQEYEKDERLELDDNEPEEYGGVDYDDKEIEQDEVQEVEVGYEVEEEHEEHLGEEEEEGDLVEEELEDVAEELEEGEEDDEHAGEEADHAQMVNAEEEEHHGVFKERRKRKEFEVFVGGLDKDATEDDLRKVFTRVGFATVEQAKKAVTELKNPVETMLEFRAGKMFFEEKKVIPDTRKGLVRIARGEEGLVHFQWLDRNRNVVEDDQIIFPDEAVFEKVRHIHLLNCIFCTFAIFIWVNQASGRVYILKFNTDDRKFFFWMQEPKAEDDWQLCSSVNYYINRPLEFLGEEEPDAYAPLQVSEDMVEDDISSRAGNLVVPNLGAEVSDVSSSSGPVKLEDLQRILSNIGHGGGAGDPDAGLGLGDILKPDLILPFIDTLPLEERLASYLPEGQWTPEDILELLQSPPFRQQMDSFTYVLRTGQIDLSQFGIDPSKYKFTVLSFLEALEDSVSPVSEESRQEDKDLTSQSCDRNDPMDESH
ncbi:uncharacterized protein LOC8282890 isoform X1 [Ricinus communis]|uniref:uncharacterized protein LOC8282890 isoform X1 n=1 Tax=Ricinus communis TaxID=3988 RepID=UPI00201A7685|nr:uncharacterized protein LOC8282890 isoform X1 [Ricinus communis]